MGDYFPVTESKQKREEREGGRGGTDEPTDTDTETKPFGQEVYYIRSAVEVWGNMSTSPDKAR